MRARIAITVAAVALACGGCASTRLYPVCVIDTADVPPSELWVSSQATLDRVLRTVLAGSDNRVVLTPTGAVVRALEFEHRQLVSVWPSLACVGSAASSAADVLLRGCQREVREFLAAAPSRSWPGSMGEVGSVCVRYLGAGPVPVTWA